MYNEMGERIMGIDLKHRAEWEKTTLRRFVITLNRNYDGDMIEFLEKKDNVRQYLMGLVRKDMNGLLPSKAQESGQTTEEPGTREI